MEDDPDIQAVLRAHGHRLTRPRMAVWEVLRATGRHLTAAEIAARAQDHSPGVNLASVYRALDVLAALGVVRESSVRDDGAATWERAHPDERFHVRCDHCGAVEHHPGDLVEEVRDHLGRGHGFEVETVELLVTGRCATCAARASAVD